MAHTRTQHFDKQQIRTFVKDAKRPWGDFAWSQFGPELREAIISQRALAVITNQAADSVEVAVMDELLLAMRIEAGLYSVQSIEDADHVARDARDAAAAAFEAAEKKYLAAPLPVDEVQLRHEDRQNEDQ